jgi:acyl carrier protein
MPTTKQKRKAQEQAEEVLLELLAVQDGKDVASLRAELSAAGEGLPVDSLDMFDVLADFRKRTGITIDKKNLRRNTMRSVEAFAVFVTKGAS